MEGSALMSEVTSAYMYSVKALPKMFESMQSAPVPPRFTHELLRTLGFKGSNDRAFINVLKGLGFIDQNSVPSKSYRSYKDKTRAKAVLAAQIRTAYSGLYATDEAAHRLPVDTVKNRLAAISGKDEAVVEKMATTFKALVSLADFETPLADTTNGSTGPTNGVDSARNGEQASVVDSPALNLITPKPAGLAFSHVLYINLPTTKDVAVYDAIFKSIREHLL
jgi:hypothetical protein